MNDDKDKRKGTSALVDALVGHDGAQVEAVVGAGAIERLRAKTAEVEREAVGEIIGWWKELPGWEYVMGEINERIAGETPGAVERVRLQGRHRSETSLLAALIASNPVTRDAYEDVVTEAIEEAEKARLKGEQEGEAGTGRATENEDRASSEPGYQSPWAKNGDHERDPVWRSDHVVLDLRGVSLVLFPGLARGIPR